MILTLDTVTMAHHPESPRGTAPGPYIDPNGVEWWLTAEKGWWGAPATRPKRTARVFAHGSFRAAAFREVRTVALSGVLIAPDDVAMRLAQRQVLSICSDPSKLYPLTVEDETGSYTAQVELDGEILSQPRNWCSVEFSLQVAAPDPRKFSASWISPSIVLGSGGTGGVDATAPGASASAPGLAAGTPAPPSIVVSANDGTVATGPVFEIVGPVTNPTVIETATGSQLVWTGTLGSGESLFINCDDQPMTPPGVANPLPGHSALIGGFASRRAGLAVWGGWPSMPPGSQRTYVLAASGVGGALHVHSRSAWI